MPDLIIDDLLERIEELEERVRLLEIGRTRYDDDDLDIDFYDDDEDDDLSN